MSTRVLLFILLAMLSACASAPKGAEYKEGSIRALPGDAVIIVYRADELKGSAIKWAVTDGTRDSVTMDPGVYFPFYVKPGHVELFALPHREFRDYLPPEDVTSAGISVIGEGYRQITNANAESKRVFAIDAKEGGTYYLKTSVEWGSMYPVAVQVDAATGEAELKGKRLPQ